MVTVPADAGPSKVGGVSFAGLDLAGAVEAIKRASNSREPLAVRLVNAYSIGAAAENPAYLEVLNSPGFNLADGTPVALILGRSRGQGMRKYHVRGPSLFRAVLSASLDADLSHYFLGTTPDTLSALTAAVERDYAGLRIAGAWAPEFGPVNDELVEECASRVSKANPDIVWVALGSPKQDFLSSRLAPTVGRPCIGVGAAFDFVAGTTDEAPVLLQKAGLEWAFRFAREPRRLWRRYTVSNWKFVRAVARQQSAASNS
ncbi:WecB/TagA/CpsF family glycosyltransferase [Gordonia sp. 4N]|uniref:WecB/TagA/CpsF family glycosyltransferase n=1 Tax=Gordonia sp. 4N TaxID=2993508 RepID=UPI003A4E5E06